MNEVEKLQQRVKELESKLLEEQSKNVSTTREKIEHMSSEVVDSNPYR